MLYLIQILRPNGATFAEERHLATLATIERTCNELRGRTRRTEGWTPHFRVYRIDRLPGIARPAQLEEVTHLIRP